MLTRRKNSGKLKSSKKTIGRLKKRERKKSKNKLSVKKESGKLKNKNKKRNSNILKRSQKCAIMQVIIIT
jgi:hypothetical protein